MTVTHAAVAAPVSDDEGTDHTWSVASRIALLVVVAVGAIVTIAAVAFYSSGGRWFIVQTPSMGVAAPVGTLILSLPVAADDLHAGDIITFHPPTAPDEVYTHRITGLTSGGIIVTKGDINGTPDPWELHFDGVIGRSIAAIPALGWAIRALPLVAIGSILLWVATSRVRSDTRRAGIRTVGLPLVVSVVTFILKPFIAIAVLGSTIQGDTATAAIVSTGILPVRIYTESTPGIVLASGQVGELDIPTLASGDYYRIATELHLPVWGWIVFAVICAAPLLWVLLVGLPPSDDDEDADEIDTDIEAVTA